MFFCPSAEGIPMRSSLGATSLGFLCLIFPGWKSFRSKRFPLIDPVFLSLAYNLSITCIIFSGNKFVRRSSTVRRALAVRDAVRSVERAGKECLLAREAEFLYVMSNGSMAGFPWAEEFNDTADKERKREAY